MIAEDIDVTIEADMIGEESPAILEDKELADCAIALAEEIEADPADAATEDDRAVLEGLDGATVDDDDLEVTLLHAAGSLSALMLCQFPLWSVQL